MAFECMEDCIHLHACRRVQAIGKKLRLMVPRYCTEECQCYVSGDSGNYITIGKALEYAMDGADSIQRGYSKYDVYAPQDLDGMTIGEIIRAEEEQT